MLHITVYADSSSVLHIHKTLTDELNINCIVNAFASANDTRKDMFSGKL